MTVFHNIAVILSCHGKEKVYKFDNLSAKLFVAMKKSRL